MVLFHTTLQRGKGTSFENSNWLSYRRKSRSRLAMTARIVIPPSPNWYSTNAVDCHRPTGLIAYAASKSLVFVWPTQERNAGFPRTEVLTDAHFQKITGSCYI